MIAHAPMPRLSVEEFERLIETGFFQPEERAELLDGEIIYMAPIGLQHVKAVRRLIRILNLKFADVAVVDCQNPIVIDGRSRPQPDILLIRIEAHEADELPRPADIFLLVEVADSTYRFDSGAKLRAYARTGIAEYWIVNTAEACVEVFRRPVGEAYSEHIRLMAGDELAPMAFPDRKIAVSETLP